MKLKIFCDHCISNFIIAELQAANCEVLRLKDHIPENSLDPVALAKAQELDCVLVSMNGDFANVITYPPAQYKGIIALELNNHPETLPELMARLKAYLVSHPDMEHYNGKLFLVEVHRIRIRQ